MQRFVSVIGVLMVIQTSCIGVSARPPEQRQSGPGGRDYRHAGVELVEVGEGAGSVRLYIPIDPPLSVDEKAPLLMFLHGYQANSKDYYAGWLNHLARRGNVVMFPVYMDTGTVPSEFLPNIRHAVERAIPELEARGVPVRLDEAVVAGHSGGGALSVNVAVSYGQGRLALRPRALLLAAPGRCIQCDQLNDLGIPMEPLYDVPGDLSLVVMNSHDDETVGTRLGRTIFDGVSHIPRSRRAYVEMQTDFFGVPELRANHRAPAAAPLWGSDWVQDALDYYGTWKVLDALIACTYGGTLCDVALGEGLAMKEMGTWSDGTPVAPMLSLDELQ